MAIDLEQKISIPNFSNVNKLYTLGIFCSLNSKKKNEIFNYLPFIINNTR